MSFLCLYITNSDFLKNICKSNKKDLFLKNIFI